MIDYNKIGLEKDYYTARESIRWVYWSDKRPNAVQAIFWTGFENHQKLEHLCHTYI